MLAPKGALGKLPVFRTWVEHGKGANVNALWSESHRGRAQFHCGNMRPPAPDHSPLCSFAVKILKPVGSSCFIVIDKGQNFSVGPLVFLSCGHEICPADFQKSNGMRLRVPSLKIFNHLKRFIAGIVIDNQVPPSRQTSKWFVPRYSPAPSPNVRARLWVHKMTVIFGGLTMQSLPDPLAARIYCSCYCSRDRHTSRCRVGRFADRRFFLKAALKYSRSTGLNTTSHDPIAYIDRCASRRGYQKRVTRSKTPRRNCGGRSHQEAAVQQISSDESHVDAVADSVHSTNPPRLQHDSNKKCPDQCSHRHAENSHWPGKSQAEHQD